MNPLYAGMHSNPYERELSSAESKMQRPPIWCLRCLVVGVVLAIILSVLCAAAVALLFIGYHEPFAGKKNDVYNFLLLSTLLLLFKFISVFADDSPSEESILVSNGLYLAVSYSLFGVRATLISILSFLFCLACGQHIIMS